MLFCKELLLSAGTEDVKIEDLAFILLLLVKFVNISILYCTKIKLSTVFAEKIKSSFMAGHLRNISVNPHY